MTGQVHYPGDQKQAPLSAHLIELDQPKFQYDIAIIRELVHAAFTDDDLDDFCRSNFKVVYSQFHYPTEKNKAIRVRELVSYALQWRELDKLLSGIGQKNISTYREFEPNLKILDPYLQSGKPSGGVVFENIAIERTNRCWIECYGSVPSLFDRTFFQCFCLSEPFVNGIDPSLDIAVINREDVPVLLTKVGVEVVSVAHCELVAGTGFPEAIKVKKADLYAIEMPRKWLKLKSSVESSPVNVREIVSQSVPDPVYLEPGAPFRYGLFFDNYMEHMPNHVVLRLWARTNKGDARSHEIIFRY